VGNCADSGSVRICSSSFLAELRRFRFPSLYCSPCVVVEDALARVRPWWRYGAIRGRGVGSSVSGWPTAWRVPRVSAEVRSPASRVHRGWSVLSSKNSASSALLRIRHTGIRVPSEARTSSHSPAAFKMVRISRSSGIPYPVIRIRGGFWLRENVTQASCGPHRVTVNSVSLPPANSNGVVRSRSLRVSVSRCAVSRSLMNGAATLHLKRPLPSRNSLVLALLLKHVFWWPAVRRLRCKPGVSCRRTAASVRGRVRASSLRAVIDTTLPTGVTPQTRDSWARARERGNVVSVTVLRVHAAHCCPAGASRRSGCRSALAGSGSGSGCRAAVRRARRGCGCPSPGGSAARARGDRRRVGAPARCRLASRCAGPDAV